MDGKMPAIKFWRGVLPAEGGYPGFNPRTEKANGIICEYDVAVTMRDGEKIYANVFRPEREGKYPVLIGWSPYGKHGHVKYAVFPKCGVCDSDFSKHVAFEADDPAVW
jgi:predicted acyl esterase